MKNPVFYRTIEIDGFSIFYRELGSERAPTLLLLHGLPSSSRMYRGAISADRRRVVGWLLGPHPIERHDNEHYGS